MVRDKENAVVNHYNVTGLGALILDALKRSNINLDALTPRDLAPIDEFHLGGRAATEHVIGLLDPPVGASVLDVGSGLGGVARYLAAERKCRATGIDITPEYVHVAEILTDMTGIADKVRFHIGSALDLPWAAANFDAAVTIHVAMNIADRPRLYSEVARVIRPGGIFAIYDVMKGPKKGMLFPVPWSETPETSFLVTPMEMRTLLGQAGFDITHEEDRREVAVEHHRERLAKLSSAGGPPALGAHLLQGPTTGLKSRNMLAMLEANQITPWVFIARRRG
jgi:ubiquinone/menaquinone biosynthesis C-methylase UbiE